MGRIKIEDLQEDQKISKEEMRKVLGGNLTALRDEIRLLGVSLHDWAQKTQWMSGSDNA